MSPFDAVLNCFCNLCHLPCRSSPPANLTVLTRQQQLQQQHNAAAFYASNAPVDTSDLMIRLRESIKQKEEFLKSPLPNVHQQQQQQQQQILHQPQQHFFPNTPPSGSPQLSMISTSSTSAGSSGLSGAVLRSNDAIARGQVRTTLVKQPLSATSSSSSTRELLAASCDMHYTPNMGSSTTGASSTVIGVSGSVSGTTAVMARGHLQHQQQRTISTTTTNGSSTLREKYHHKDEFLETLQETGVTNKVWQAVWLTH
ncbi:hypothetical protein DOY81_013026 [Sarcophaga bullata]|nr:hypothetical protein DOY81_013026 [Sarcophaga bullata]